MMRGLLLVGTGLGRAGRRRRAFGRDQRVDPFEVSLGGIGAVLEQRARVAVAAAGASCAGPAAEPVGERGAPAREQLEAGLGIEVAAERELEREGALVVARGVVVEEQLREAARRPAAVIR